VIRACYRRWYVFLPILLLTAWIGFHQFNSVKTVFYSNTVVGIAPPSESIPYLGEGRAVPRNGLIEVGGPDLLTTMTTIGLGDESARQAVIRQGGTGSFTVRQYPSPVTGAGSTLSIPLLMVEATESTAELAQKTVQLAAREADSVMQAVQRQAGVPEPLIVRALTFSQPKVVPAIPSRNKKLYFTLFSGIVAAALAAVSVELIMSRRAASASRGLTKQGRIDGDDDRASGEGNWPPR
jgi:hypothetical protein